MGVAPRSDKMDFANPTFEQMTRHWFDSSNPSVESFAHSRSPFLFVGGRHGGLLVDRLRLLLTHEGRSKVVLQAHPGDNQRVHHFWGQ
jgi:hypothetical protein